MVSFIEDASLKAGQSLDKDDNELTPYYWKPNKKFIALDVETNDKYNAFDNFCMLNAINQSSTLYDTPEECLFDSYYDTIEDSLFDGDVEVIRQPDGFCKEDYGYYKLRIIDSFNTNKGR